MADSHHITSMLQSAAAGDKEAAEGIWAAIHADVHAMAVRAMRHESKAVTLQPTMLVNEVFLRIHQSGIEGMENRRHLFGSISRAMGQFLVDHARGRDRKKRGGGQRGISLTLVPGELADLREVSATSAADAIESLERLERDHPRAAEVARLRYLVGLTVEQVAEIVEIAPRTVKKDWAFARSWMQRDLLGEDGPGDSGDEA